MKRISGFLLALVNRFNRQRNEWLLVIAFILTLPLVNPYIRGDGN